MPCSSQGPSGGTLPASNPRTAQAGREDGIRRGPFPSPLHMHPNPAYPTDSPPTASLRKVGSNSILNRARCVRPGPGRGTTTKSPWWTRSRTTCALNRLSVCWARHRSCPEKPTSKPRSSVSSVSQENSPRSCDRTTPWRQNRHEQRAVPCPSLGPTIQCPTFWCFSSSNVAMMAVLITAELATLAADRGEGADRGGA